MRRGWSVDGGGNGSNIYVIVIALGDMSIALNPFNSTDQKKCFANNVDPDELARTNCLIKIYTVCLFFLFSHCTVRHFVLDFGLRGNPY